MDEKENVIIHLGDNIYLIPLQQIKLSVWNVIPEWIKTHESVDAKIPENALIRTAIKGVLITLGPKILKRMNTDIVPPKKVDIISWWVKLFCNILYDSITKEDWIINVKKCEECGEGIFKVNNITPYTTIIKQTIKTNIQSNNT